MPAIIITIIFVFFAVCTASNLVAGGKLFASAFEASCQAGVWLTLEIVLAHIVIGKLLAVSLTDFVQGCIMLGALIIMRIIVLHAGEAGGADQAGETLSGVEGFTMTAGPTIRR